tara:strand:+ start:3795 stop:4496 length:702 start_codon:yes stop_codon:yes gene_type:complete
MKTVILAGGKGLRIFEETKLKPKPMIKIGGIPLILHIMDIYKFYGFNDFIICGGYKYKVLKYFFRNKKKYFNVKIINTGNNTQTAGRLVKVKKYLRNEKEFFLTYGDGLANLNIKKLLKFHRKKNTLATVTAVKKNLNFGMLKITSKNLVNNFIEKPNNQLINGGFFVFSNKIFKHINSKKSIEFDCLPKLAKNKNLSAYKHDGFWQCLDNSKDKKYLEKKWKEKNCPWKNLK